MALFVLSAATHLLFFPRPAEVVFDEVYFVTYANDYSLGTYYFDPHPPLGKLLLAAAGHLSGISGINHDYSNIGNKYQTDTYIWYRLLPLLAGILLPLVVYWLCRRLRFSALAAFSAGLFIILENSLLVQSRFAFLDSMLILAGFTSLAAYLQYRSLKVPVTFTKRFEMRRCGWLILTALWAAVAFDFKWTGLAFSLIIVLIELWDIVGAPRKMVAIKHAIKFFVVLLVVGLTVYMVTFAVHFTLLPKSGQGNAFMSAAFQKTLIDSTYRNDPTISTPGFLVKFFELNEQMYSVNAHMNAAHQYSSKWYTWPFMARPIFYWQGSASSTAAMVEGTATAPIADRDVNSYIYLFGNPFIYWLGALVMTGLIVNGLWLLSIGSLVKDRKIVHRAPVFIAVGFLVNFLPFIFIGRVMFLYHYQAALVFSILAIAYILDQLKGRRKYILIGAAILLALTAFIFWSPISYGTPLSQEQLQSRMWFPNWR